MFTTEGIVAVSDTLTKKIISAYPELFDDALGTVLVPEPLTITTLGPIPIIAEYFLDGSSVGMADEDLLFEKILVNDIDAFLVRHYNGATGTIGRDDCYLEIFSSLDLSAELGLVEGSKVSISLYREQWWGGSQVEF